MRILLFSLLAIFIFPRVARAEALPSLKMLSTPT